MQIHGEKYIIQEAIAQNVIHPKGKTVLSRLIIDYPKL